MCDDDILHGFTEYKCQLQNMENETNDYIFRAHPSFHCDSGQISGVWYDWAIIDINEKKIPCQILLFLEISKFNYGLNNEPQSQNSKFAIIRHFADEPKQYHEGYSSLVRYGSLLDGLYMINCDQILQPCAVVPNVLCEKDQSNIKIHALGINQWFMC